jgi:hypothetical protein
MKSALYGRTAKPDVRRRFGDRDPVARQAAEIIERSLIYCAETYDVDKPIEAALHDGQVTGRGVVRIEYEPVIKTRPVLDPLTGAPVTGDDGKPVEEEFIAEQRLRERFVYWEDYLQAPARCWDDVWWVAFRHVMGREDLRALNAETAGDVPLNWAPLAESRRDVPEHFKKAELWEIWDRTKRRRVWIVKGFDRPVREDEDPYGLEGFYPLPEPLRDVDDTETQVPTPPFALYRDQADDLDEITARISRLTRALKRRGVYDQGVKELKRLARAGDNEFIPVENWAKLAQKGGLEAAFQTEDIKMVAEVLTGLYNQRNALVQQIYEVTGISDILRGATDPNETLGAQNLKAQFGSQRMKKRQRAVQKWIAALYKLKAEIIAEHFEANVLQEMTAVQVTPDVLQLLRSDKLRSYRIDIETDSTIFEDAEQEKKARTEVLTAMGAFLREAIPATQQIPEMGPLLFEMLTFGMRSFKAGRLLEDKIEETTQLIAQRSGQAAAAQQPPQQPPADPVAEAKAKAEMDRSQLERERFEWEKRKDARESDRQLAAEGLTTRKKEDGSDEIVPAEQVLLQAIEPMFQQFMQSQDDQSRAIEGLAQSHAAQAHALAGLAQSIEAAQNAPRRLVYGPDGLAAGVEINGQVRPIVRDGQNRPVGLS